MAKQRGRVKGSINYTTIKDDVIAPYVIYKDENCFSVVKTTKDETKLEEEGEGNEKTMGYYQQLSAALEKIALLKTNTKRSYTVKEYITEYNNNLKTFREAILI